MPGLVQSKPLRKMGIHSSPTGELFLEDVKVGKDRLLGALISDAQVTLSILLHGAILQYALRKQYRY